MIEYRLYLRDAARHIADVISFPSPDDRAAIAVARRSHRRGCPCDLWQGARPVATFLEQRRPACR